MTTGVLVMAYGSPEGPDDIEAYYTHVRRGRPPEPDQLAELRSRYEAIGGVSTMRQRTSAQVGRLRAALDRSPNGGFLVEVGTKHAEPFIEDGVAALVAAGVDRIVGLVLAPHHSAGSVGQYHTRAVEALADTAGSVGSAADPVDYRPIEHWHLLPAYLDFLTEAVREARARLPERHKVFFTAHALPVRTVSDGDPYADQLAASARAVADRLGLSDSDWATCYQSAGRTPDPWTGPDINEVIRELAATGRTDGVLVCPQGFVADHLEVAYDLDIDARRIADEAGLAYDRTRVLNDDEAVFVALAELIIGRASIGAAS